MARSGRGTVPRGRAQAARRAGRRAWPYVLMAWERWQKLSPQEKERYKRRAREYAGRGRQALDQRRGRRGPGSR
jgi:hypothetical protein